MCGCMCTLGVEAQTRIRPRKKSGMFPSLFGTASHCEDLDLRCGHHSPGELIDAYSMPVGEADKWYSSKVRV